MNREEQKTSIDLKPDRRREKRNRRIHLWLVGFSIGCMIAFAWFYFQGRGQPPVADEKGEAKDVGAIETVEEGHESKVLGHADDKSRFLLNATPARFETLRRQLEPLGWYPYDLEWVVRGGKSMVSCVFRDLESKSYFGLDQNELARTLAMHEDTGLQILDFEFQRTGAEKRYSATFAKLAHKQELKHPLTRDEFETLIENRGDDIVDIDIKFDDGEYVYALVVASGGSVSTKTRHGMNLVEFEVFDKKMVGQEFINRKVQAHNLDDGDIRFSGIWDTQKPVGVIRSVQRKMLDPISLVETNRSLAAEGFVLIDLGTAQYEGEQVFSAVWLEMEKETDDK